MPSMGRPQLNSTSYSNIKIKNTQKPQEQQTGDYLNKLAGNRGRVKYVKKADHNKMGKDEFLHLLTVQLQHQDPLNPMDQKKFAADLAQFSQLEQLSNMNSKMDKMSENNGDEQKFYGASLIGKLALTSGASVDYDGKSSNIKIPFELQKDAKNLIVRIYDTKGQLIKQIDEEAKPGGHHVVKWDGLMMDGTVATKGTYAIEVKAWDESLTPFSGKTKGSGIVTGVQFENGETVLILNGKKRARLKDIDSFEKTDDNSNKIIKPDLTKNLTGLDQSSLAGMGR